VKRLAFPLIGIIFTTLVFLPIVRAEDTAQQGVTMTVYDGVMLGLGPWQQEPEQPVCYSGVVTMIDFDWGGAPAVEGCPQNFFMVHFTGWLTVPESGQWEFLNWSDDGWYMMLDGVITIDDWNFHGCGGHWSGPNEGYSQLVAGQSYALDIWMFEWGGGACARLWYGAPTLGYGVVPAAWLTTSALPAPTPTPSPEPSLEPSVKPTPEPSPSESPSPDPTPSVEPLPSVKATPSEVPSVQPSPIPSPTPTPKPSPTPDHTPEPSASESASPDLSPVPSDSPSVAPSVEPEPSPSASPDNIAEQTAAAVGEAVAAVAETVTKAIEAITNLGKDLSPAEKKKAAPVAVAIVISQVASAAVAAASSAAAAARKVDK
jgi:hypothetical protein